VSARRSQRAARAERREVTIEKIVPGGFGLARAPEVILVPRAFTGERVAVEIDRAHRPARGRVLAVLEASPSRVTPACAIVERCGACDLMHLSPEAQRVAREEILRAAIPAKMATPEIAHHAATPARGRTRARWHGKALGDRTVVGYRAAGSRTIVAPDVCPILDPRLEAALVDARAILEGARGEGEVHAALGRGGAPVLAVVWKGELAPAGYAACEARVKSGRLAGVEIALEGARVPAIVGDPRPISAGEDRLPMIAPPRGFAQASEAGDAVLVRVVVERARAEGARVLELFAGSGNLTVPLARVAAHVTSVEIVPAACAAARENVEAREDLAQRVKIVQGDADVAAIPQGTDVVVLDPPRSGAPGAAKAIAARHPKRVVYVSCDPPTLGRDLGTLADAGYVLEALDAIDLFPETSHVETVATLRFERAERKPA
jgi:23S rRNA (uracil1939-C5)-methyltransferase